MAATRSESLWYFSEVRFSLRRQLFEVLDPADRRQSIRAKVRTDDQRLVFVVADDPNAHRAVHLRQVILEFAAELGIGDVVNETGKTAIAFDGHPRQRANVLAVLAQIADVVKKPDVLGSDRWLKVGKDREEAVRWRADRGNSVRRIGRASPLVRRGISISPKEPPP